MSKIIVYEVLGYDENNLFLTETDLDYYKLKEEGFVELGCHSIMFEDRELCSFLERDEVGFYREKDINSFFIKDNILYVPFLDGTQGRINKFLWGWDNFFDKMDNPELFNNIIFDGEKHIF